MTMTGVMREGAAQRQEVDADQGALHVVRGVDGEIEEREERVEGVLPLGTAGPARQRHFLVVAPPGDEVDGLAGEGVEDLDAAVVEHRQVAQGRQVDAPGQGDLLLRAGAGPARRLAERVGQRPGARVHDLGLRVRVAGGRGLRPGPGREPHEH